MVFTMPEWFSSGKNPRQPPHTPRIPKMTLPFDSPRDTLYLSDSALLAPVVPGSRKKSHSSRTRTTSRYPSSSRPREGAMLPPPVTSHTTSMDDSSRLRNPKQPPPKAAKPLKPCLKQSKPSVVPERTRNAPAPSVADLANQAMSAGYGSMPLRSTSMGASSSQDRLESRQRRGRYDSVPSEPYIPTSVSNRTRHHVSRNSNSSDTSTETQASEPFAYLSPPKVEDIALQPLLKGVFSKRTRQLVYFDVAFDPRRQENVKQYFRLQNGEMVSASVPSTTLDLPASTHTDLTKMFIYCPRGPLGRAPIQIERPEGIRCIDVLKELYDVYNRTISADDSLHIGPEYLKTCRRHFETRCADVAHPPSNESRWGMKYVDLLRGSRRRVFKGLKQRSDNPACWDLYFEDPDTNPA